MLTLFAIPKPFAGHIGVIQRNALASWCALGVQVVLLGNEPGLAEAAADTGAMHLPHLERNEHGTPRLDTALAQVDEIAVHPVRCFVNSDIVLLDDFLPAVERALAAAPRVLVVGRTTDLDVREPLALDRREVRDELRRRALAEGRDRGAVAIDWFVFERGLLDPVPPFVIGRASFDNWIVWRGRQRGLVVDATAAVVAVHERHDYAHVDGGLMGAYYGPEAERNMELVRADGGKIFTLHDASHMLRADGDVRRNWGSMLRTRDRLRKVGYKLGRR